MPVWRWRWGLEICRGSPAKIRTPDLVEISSGDAIKKLKSSPRARLRDWIRKLETMEVVQLWRRVHLRVKKWLSSSSSILLNGPFLTIIPLVILSMEEGGDQLSCLTTVLEVVLVAVDWSSGSSSRAQAASISKESSSHQGSVPGVSGVVGEDSMVCPIMLASLISCSTLLFSASSDSLAFLSLSFLSAMAEGGISLRPGFFDFPFLALMSKLSTIFFSSSIMMARVFLIL